MGNICAGESAKYEMTPEVHNLKKHGEIDKVALYSIKSQIKDLSQNQSLVLSFEIENLPNTDYGSQTDCFLVLQEI